MLTFLESSKRFIIKLICPVCDHEKRYSLTILTSPKSRISDRGLEHEWVLRFLPGRKWELCLGEYFLPGFEPFFYMGQTISRVDWGTFKLKSYDWTNMMRKVFTQDRAVVFRMSMWEDNPLLAEAQTLQLPRAIEKGEIERVKENTSGVEHSWVLRFMGHDKCELCLGEKFLPGFEQASYSGRTMSYWIPRVDYGKIKLRSQAGTELMEKVLAPSYAVAFNHALSEGDLLIDDAHAAIQKHINKSNVMGGMYPRWVR